MSVQFLFWKFWLLKNIKKTATERHRIHKKEFKHSSCTAMHYIHIMYLYMQFNVPKKAPLGCCKLSLLHSLLTITRRLSLAWIDHTDHTDHRIHETNGIVADPCKPHKNHPFMVNIPWTSHGSCETSMGILLFSFLVVVKSLAFLAWRLENPPPRLAQQLGSRTTGFPRRLGNFLRGKKSPLGLALRIELSYIFLYGVEGFHEHAFTNKQTNKQTSKQTNKQTNKSNNSNKLYSRTKQKKLTRKYIWESDHSTYSPS